MAELGFVAGVLRALYHHLPRLCGESSLSADGLQELGHALARLLELDTNSLVDALKSALAWTAVESSLQLFTAVVGDQLVRVASAEAHDVRGQRSPIRALLQTWMAGAMAAGVRHR